MKAQFIHLNTAAANDQCPLTRRRLACGRTVYRACASKSPRASASRGGGKGPRGSLSGRRPPFVRGRGGTKRCSHWPLRLCSCSRTQSPRSARGERSAAIIEDRESCQCARRRRAALDAPHSVADASLCRRQPAGRPPPGPPTQASSAPARRRSRQRCFNAAGRRARAGRARPG